MEEEQEVVIVGAGIAGLATALALQRYGVHSLVLERSHELRTTGAAIVIFPNAWRALDALGIAQNLASSYQPMGIGLVTNLDTGEKIQMSFPQSDRVMGARPVHRKKLLEALAKELPADAIRFSSKLASIKSELKDSSTITVLHLEDGTVIKTKVLIGCDGVQSVVAQWLGLAAPVSSGRSAVRGLSIFPKGDDQLKCGVQQFLSHGKRAGVAPLNETDSYWFITHDTTPREKEMAKDFTRDPSLLLREVTENLAKDFPELYLKVVRHSDLSSITCAPLMLRAPWNVIMGQNHKGNVTVAGDAMHPMTPDLGQGGCSALEDAVVLAQNIGRTLADGGSSSGRRVEEGMERYVKERRWRVAGLIVASYLSGWVQQGGSGLWGWAVRCFRDYVFYRFLYGRISAVVKFDCGDLVTD